MSSEFEQRDTIGQEKGIYTLTEPDMRSVSEIEQERQAFDSGMLTMSKLERMDETKSLLTRMRIIMESYEYNNYLDENKIEGYGFYDVLKLVDFTEGDVEYIRRSMQIASTIWRNVIRQLGWGVPTYRSSVKKKLWTASLT